MCGCFAPGSISLEIIGPTRNYLKGNLLDFYEQAENLFFSTDSPRGWVWSFLPNISRLGYSRLIPLDRGTPFSQSPLRTSDFL